MKDCSTIYKENWDKKTKVREINKGDLVYMRKLGINTKLSESWAGPYHIVKRNSPLSYKVSTGDRTIVSVHISLLKEYMPRIPDASVKRVTTVLEPDTVSYSMDQQYSELVIPGRADSDNREQDIKDWVEEYSDTLTKEPGLTKLAEFKLEMGDHQLIAQRPYYTPRKLLTGKSIG